MAAFTLAALKSEVQADPAALGYAGKSDSQIADLLNAPTVTLVFRNNIGVQEVINAIVAADFVALTAVQLAKLQLLFSGGATVDATSANTRTIFTGIFAGMAATITALTALAQRPGSRAEILWGVGTVVDHITVARALRG